METVDRTGTFLGSLWESRTNIGSVLLEAGLAKLQTSFGVDRIPDSQILAQAEQSAKLQKLKVCHCVMHLISFLLFLLITISITFFSSPLKIWENYVEGQENTNGSSAESKEKEVLKVEFFSELTYDGL